MASGTRGVPSPDILDPKLKLPPGCSIVLMKGLSESGNSFGSSARMNPITPPACVVDAKARRSPTLVLQYEIITHTARKWPSPSPVPLEKTENGLKIEETLHPPEVMTTLVEEIHGNDWVVHQVLSNPRKVDQEGYIMGSEPSGWPDPRKHQDLFGNVRLKNKYAAVCSHGVNELPRH